MSEPQNTVQVYTPPAQISKTNETAGAILGARVAKEIEARTLVAIGRPRNIDNVRSRILHACERTRFADAAMYEKPVGGGSKASGLSIRFAEEAARHYGNLSISSFVVSEDDDRRVIKVSAVDLESNNSFDVDVVIAKTVERKKPRDGDEKIRVRRNSKNEEVWIIRADEDALLTKQNAHIAKAQREVILKHIPSDIKEEAEEKIEQVLRERTEKDPDGEKKKILDSFYSVGVMPSQIVEFLGHPLEQTTPAEIDRLRKIFRGIRDEGATWADIMETKRTATKPGEDTQANNSETRKSSTAQMVELLKQKESVSVIDVNQEGVPQPPVTESVVERVCNVCKGKIVGGQGHDPECKYYAD